jgi:hypothetical protein
MQLLNVGFALHSCVRGNSETIYNSRRKLFGQSTLNTQSGLADLPFLDLTSQKAHRIWKALEGTADGYQKKILRLKTRLSISPHKASVRIGSMASCWIRVQTALPPIGSGVSTHNVGPGPFWLPDHCPKN